MKLTVTLAGGKQEEMEFDCLLVAVGRKPNTDTIGIENTKVELDRGFIKVNEFQQTGEPGVYAIGDVVAGTPQLAHVATMEGMVALDHMTGKHGDPDQQESHSGRNLHRAGHRQRGHDGGAGESGGIRGEGREVPVRWAIAKPRSSAVMTDS